MGNRIKLGSGGIDLEGAKEFKITGKEIDVFYESGAVMRVGLQYEPFISNHFSHKSSIETVVKYAAFALLATSLSWYFMADNIIHFVMGDL